MDEVMPVVERYVDWNASIILVVSVVIVILLVVSQIIFPGFYKHVMYRMFVENFSGRSSNSRPVEVSAIEAVTVIISLLSISTMIFAAICYSGISSINMEHGSEWKTALIVLLSVAIYNQLKGLANLFFGYVFRLHDYAVCYNTLILDAERMLSLLFLPLFAFCPFVSAEIAVILTWIAFGCSVLLVGLQYVTYFLHLLKNNFLNHYSILYFCALEVLPILVVVKIMF